MVFHKIGTIVVNSTDNLLLSKFIGLAAAGIYANYYMFTSALTKVLTQIFASVTASVGNLNVSDDLPKKREIYNRLMFMNFWVYSWSTVGLLCLLQPIIKLMFGNNYLFDYRTVFVICVCYFVTGMRKTVLTYKDASGLYYRDWFKPLLEAIVNLIASLLFLKWFDAAGIFLGTIVSTLGVSAWIEAYIVYRDILQLPFINYFITYLKYIAITIIVGGISLFFCSIITTSGLIDILLSLIIAIIVPNTIYTCVFYKSEEFIYYKNLVKTIFLKAQNKFN